MVKHWNQWRLKDNFSGYGLIKHICVQYTIKADKKYNRMLAFISNGL